MHYVLKTQFLKYNNHYVIDIKKQLLEFGFFVQQELAKIFQGVNFETIVQKRGFVDFLFGFGQKSLVILHHGDQSGVTVNNVGLENIHRIKLIENYSFYS